MLTPDKTKFLPCVIDAVLHARTGRKGIIFLYISAETSQSHFS